MLASVAVAVVLSRRTQSALGLSPRERLGIGLGAFCGAMIGGQAAVRARRLGGPLSGRAWFDNGKTIVFGLVGGYFGVELAKALLGSASRRATASPCRWRPPWRSGGWDASSRAAAMGPSRLCPGRSTSATASAAIPPSSTSRPST